MTIKVLGTGCPKCQRLEHHTQKALEQLNQDVEVQKVEDMADIMQYNIMQTPALVVNDEVVLTGNVPAATSLAEMLEPYFKNA